MGAPCKPGAEGNGALHGQQGLPGCPLPPAYLQEGGVGGIQLGVTLHLWAKGMILAPWGALSLAEVAHGYHYWPMAPQLAHPTPARWRQGARTALSPQNHHPFAMGQRGPSSCQAVSEQGWGLEREGRLVRHPVYHTRVYKHTSMLVCIEVHVLEEGRVCMQLHIVYKHSHLHSTCDQL